MKVFISGAISGRIEEARRQFNEAARDLRFSGYEVVNPFDIGTSVDLSWRENMEICIKELIHCDLAVFLVGWEKSKGSLLEFNIAKELDIKIVMAPKYFHSGWIVFNLLK